MIQICQVIELGPTGEQVARFYRHCAAARIARNDLVALWKGEGDKPPAERTNYLRLRPRFNSSKRNERPWMAEVSQNAVKGGLIDAEDAIRRFYKKESRAPRFHARGKRDSFRCDNGVGTVKVDGKTLVLPAKCGGQVRMKESLRWPGKMIRRCRVRRKADRWFASVAVEIDQAEYGQKSGAGTVGIDLGLHTFVVLAPPGAGEAECVKVDAPAPFRQAQKRMRLYQRRLSRCKRGSKRRRKAVTRVAKLHIRIDDVRKDFLHQLSHRITAEYAQVNVETLSIKGWQRRFGRKTGDLAPSEFLRQLQYKTSWRDGLLDSLPWNFPSSKLCHDCGWRYAGLTIAERRWACLRCGVVHDRDANAALNLRDYGPELPGDCSWMPCKTTATAAKAVEPRTEDSTGSHQVLVGLG